MDRNNKLKPDFMNRSRGLTLLEVLMVIVLIAVVSAIAIPSFVSIRESMLFREATRGVNTVLRTAKARAIANNRQVRVQFETANRRYRLQVCDTAGAAYFCGAWDDPNTWVVLNTGVTINVQAGMAPNVSTIVFSPSATPTTSPSSALPSQT